MMQSGLVPHDTLILSESQQLDTRLFGRGDALAGFDLRSNELEEQQKQKEQELW
jgi:hypothetical protein